MFEGKKLREKLHSGQICLGTWVTSTDPCVTELLCGSGFDFIIIDTEHTALDTELVQHCLMATKGSDVAPMVRVAWNDPVLIKHVLDVGAAGVLVPHVSTPEAVQQAIAACMYPPVGIRAFGPRRPGNYGRQFAEYIETANDHIVVWVQIEDVDAVNNIEQIARIPRLDGVIFGPYDLAGSLGVLSDPGHPLVIEAIDKTIAAAREAGVPVGFTASAAPEAAFEWLLKGVQFMTLGADTSYLMQASQTAVSGVKKLINEQLSVAST